MEQATHHSEEALSSPQGCANCAHPVVVEGYPTPLCADCRAKFTNYPIPLLIKVFAGVILVTLIVALFNFQKNFSAGIHYQRAKTAIHRANYNTAENELKKTLSAIPNFAGAKEYLAIASFNNGDMGTFLKEVQELQGKEVKETEIYGQLNEIIQKGDNYLPSDSFTALYEKYQSFDSIPQEIYKQYVTAHPDQLFAVVQYASVLFDQKDYSLSDSLVDNILQVDDSYAGALNLKTALKRELHQFDSAHYYCDRILALNKESSYGMSSKARTYLKEKKDTLALQWALKAYTVDQKDPYSIATLVMAYHYNNKIDARDKLLEALKRDSAQTFYLQYAVDVINGKEKFRE